MLAMLCKLHAAGTYDDYISTLPLKNAACSNIIIYGVKYSKCVTSEVIII